MNIHIAWNKTNTNVECLTCHKIFHTPPSRLKGKYIRKYCSPECSHKGRLGFVPWNKGRFGVYSSETLLKMSNSHPKKMLGQEFATPKNRRDRVKFIVYIRKQVLERDGYVCQICGGKEMLQVDHIQPWADYVELRFDINNCRTLCQKCHYKITYGREMTNEAKLWGKGRQKGVVLA